jgi:hypothetical protein
VTTIFSIDIRYCVNKSFMRTGYSIPAFSPAVDRSRGRPRSFGLPLPCEMTRVLPATGRSVANFGRRPSLVPGRRSRPVIHRISSTARGCSCPCFRFVPPPSSTLLSQPPVLGLALVAASRKPRPMDPSTASGGPAGCGGLGRDRAARRRGARCLHCPDRHPHGQRILMRFWIKCTRFRKAGALLREYLACRRDVA